MTSRNNHNQKDDGSKIKDGTVYFMIISLKTKTGRNGTGRLIMRSSIT